MIVFEDVIEALVSQIPAIDGFKPNFHWGNQDELNRYIALKKQPYPIIWLENGIDEHDDRSGNIERNCRFIIAVRELELNELNNYRLKNSFENFLIPLSERLIEGLRKFSQTELIDLKYRTAKHPNYSESDKNKTIDMWDAITVDCRVKVYNRCVKTIKWSEC